MLPPGLQQALQPQIQQLGRLAEPLWPYAEQGIRQAVQLLHVCAQKLVESALFQQLAAAVGPQLQAAADATDAALHGYPPWQIALLAAGLTLLLMATAEVLDDWLAPIRRQGLVQWACSRLRAAPIIRGLLDREKAKVKAKIAAGIKRDGLSITRLPQQGRSAQAVLQLLRAKEARDVKVAPGSSSMSGCVYIVDQAHKQLLDETFALFSWTNPLHADVFPSVRQMEAEVVAMTAAMLHGGPGTSAPEACGAMTSGGTESILLAVKASRDFMAATRGISRPEMVIGLSAHAAYIKAAEYFNIKLVKAPVGADFRLHGAAVSRCITSQTVLVVASAPGYPHGVVDDVVGIAAAAARRGVPCHVDACLGGFLLPFVERLGYEVPLFDFRVQGVTSMSVDTHKYGQAHKGSSVVLYRSPDLRAAQFTSITDWSGGLYISPSMAGSRNGALVATAWASLVHLGESGLLDAAENIMRAVRNFRKQLPLEVPELRVLGQPHMSVVAFAACQPRQLNVFCLNDLLTAKGWHLNALQSPPALHFCFTAQHTNVVPALVADIKECVVALKKDPKGLGSAGSAPLYGLAGVSPDRGLIGEFLVAFQDAMLAP